ncbi:class I SAM-dependent methyltransferase [Patulibacter sp.]|uniref:class I SAM-dependent methyltransferase n=1 Tax=Patulibacter sp. TaxID=1912859 RepID=UPI002717CB66|nr:methyltransferase domain-containing protein [Patulibacter sp.]MDO9407890.1 methyltransferase domain-containing protein [Patulibacter sp.]
MRTVQDTWSTDRIVAALYDTAVQRPVTAWLGARVLWGFDFGVIDEEIRRLGELPAGTRVLDLPTGGGLALKTLRPDHGLDYVAADLSTEMLDRAASRASSRALTGVRFAEADASALEFADDAFDVVLSLTGLHCFAEPAAALAEFRRVLRPGGELRLTTVVRGAGRRHDDAVRLLRGLGVFGHVGTPEDLGRWLDEAGFRHVDRSQSGALAIVRATA